MHLMYHVDLMGFVPENITTCNTCLHLSYTIIAGLAVRAVIYI